MAKANTLWHGAFTQMGPVSVTVKSAIMKSKFSKPNAPKPDYVELEIAGAVHYYNLENPSCGDVFANKKGQTFTVVAEGREDTATVRYVGQSGATIQQPAQPPQPPTQPAQPAPTPSPTNGPAKDTKYAVQHIARNLALATIALQAAETKRKEYEEVFKREIPHGLHVALFTSLLYGANAAGVQDSLPLKVNLHPLDDKK